MYVQALFNVKTFSDQIYLYFHGETPYLHFLCILQFFQTMERSGKFNWQEFLTLQNIGKSGQQI